MFRRAKSALVGLSIVMVGCGGGRPERVVLTRGERIPSVLAKQSRDDLADYYARVANTVETGTSVSVLARLVDRSYVRAAVLQRAREGRWSRDRARRELAQSVSYYLDDRLSFEIEVEALVEAGMATRRFADIGSWQWTLVVDGGEPIVATDATTTRKHMYREQTGGGYFTGSAYVPEPMYVIEHHELKGVVRFGAPAPVPRRSLTLRVYPPGVPSVLQLRWRVARAGSRGA